MTGEPSPARGGGTGLRWNVVLCAGIVVLAIAFVAGVLFLAGPPGGSTGQAPTGLPAKTVTVGKSLVASKAKILPRAEAASPPQPVMEMHPTEPNMTVIGKTSEKLSHTRTEMEVDVINPPFRIDLEIVPKTVIETKWFVNRTLTKKEEIVQVPVVWPSTFANLSVIEKETGRIVAQAGFGRDDNLDYSREIRVYKPGKYLVQLYGNDVAVRTVMSMRTPGRTF